MSIEVKVSLGDIYITTTQDDSELAIKEAMQTIADEISIAISKSSQYEVVGDNYNDQEGECDKCCATYDIGSQDNRCGNCSNCGSCCTHKGEGE